MRRPDRGRRTRRSYKGSPGTWEALRLRSEPNRVGEPRSQSPWPPTVRLADGWSESSSARAVPAARGTTKVPRGRTRGVVASQYDRRSGGTDPRDPAEGRGKPGRGSAGKAGGRGIDPTNLLTELLDSDAGCGSRQRTSFEPQRRPRPEEPDAGKLHVRICEGPGWVTAPGYSAWPSDRAF
jgi:hypothetical protein